LFNQRDHAHRVTEEQKQKVDGADRDRLRFHMLRTLSRSREHHIEEEGGDPVTLITHSLSHLHTSHLCSRVSCFRLVLLRAEEEDDEKEDVLFNLAQTVNLSYFDYHSPDVIGEATEITPNIPSTRPNTTQRHSVYMVQRAEPHLAKLPRVPTTSHSRHLRSAGREREEGRCLFVTDEAHARRVRAPAYAADLYAHCPLLPADASCVWCVRPLTMGA
jgi:hypothetical protein